MEPAGLEATLLLSDGTSIHFRAVQPGDAALVRKLFYSLSQQSIYNRFMHNLRQLSPKQAQELVSLPSYSDVGIAGVLPEGQGEALIAMGGYYVNPQTNMAEVALVVRDDLHNKGIGTFLLTHLAKIAKSHGISGFTAEVLPGNQAMQAVFEKLGFQSSITLDDEVLNYWIEF